MNSVTKTSMFIYSLIAGAGFSLSQSVVQLPFEIYTMTHMDTFSNQLKEASVEFGISTAKWETMLIKEVNKK